MPSSPVRRLLPRNTSAMPTHVRPAPNASAASGETIARGSGRSRVRSISASASRSMYMFSAFEAATSSAVPISVMIVRQCAISPGASHRPPRKVMITMSVMRGLARRTIMTLIGTALLVAASNALNMYMERDADALMDRTRDRPLPRAIVSPEAALAFGAGLTCVGIALVFLGSNLLTGLLGMLAVSGYVAVYTPLKRVSGAAVFVGAIPGALPPLMGWTAVTGHLDAPGLALFAVLFLWQIPHFLAIAIYRGADYARAGFKVLPLTVSARVTRATMLAFSVLLVAVTIALEPLHVAGPRYALVAALLGAIFIGWAAAGFRRAAESRWARS